MACSLAAHRRPQDPQRKHLCQFTTNRYVVLQLLPHLGSVSVSLVMQLVATFWNFTAFLYTKEQRLNEHGDPFLRYAIGF